MALVTEQVPKSQGDLSQKPQLQNQQVESPQQQTTQTSDPSVSTTQQGMDQAQNQNQNQNQTFAKPTRKYPTTDKNVWGKEWWGVMQQIASQFPENPNRTDRLEFGTWYKFMFKNLPCVDPCRSNTYQYLQNHPLSFKNRSTLFESVVNFHNQVNRDTGKNEQYNWKELLDKQTNENCPTCNLSPHDTQQHEFQHEDTGKQKLQIIKTAITELVNDYAAQRNQPAPRIHWNSCPDGSNTSCITKDGNDVFFDPNNASPKTIYHELHHWEKIRKGEQVDDNNNPEADQYAYQQIKNNFPFDQEQPEQTVQNVPGIFTHIHDVPQEMGTNVQATDIGTNKYQALVKDVYSQPSAVAANPNGLNDFPQFSQTLQQIQKEELAEQVVQHEKTKGILSHIDMVYEYPASLLGMSAADLNMTHTPQILSNASQAILESFTTSAASLVISIIIGLLTMFGGLVLKDKMPVRDLIFIQNLGGQFFWEFIRAFNPKRIYKLKKEFEDISKDVQDGQFSWRDLIETQKDLEHSANRLKMKLLKAEDGEAAIMVPDQYAGHYHANVAGQGSRFPNQSTRMEGPSSQYYDERPLLSSVGRDQLRYNNRSNTIRLKPYQTSDSYY